MVMYHQWKRILEAVPLCEAKLVAASGSADIWIQCSWEDSVGYGNMQQTEQSLSWASVNLASLPFTLTVGLGTPWMEQ